MTRHNVVRERTIAPILTRLVSGEYTENKALHEAYEKGYSRGAMFHDPDAIGNELDVLGNKLQALSLLVDRVSMKDPNNDLVNKMSEIINIINRHYHALNDILLNPNEDKVG